MPAPMPRRNGGAAMDPRGQRAPQPQQPVPTPDASGGAAATGGNRGYVVTLHVITPNPNGIALINTAVVDRLRTLDREADAAAAKAHVEKRTYKITRIYVPKNVQFDQDSERIEFLKARATAAL